jgi:hypothetical protein
MTVFFLWTLYVYFYRGTYKFAKEEERSFVERARGMDYFFSLIITFVIYTFGNFYTSLESQIVEAIIGVAFLEIVDTALPRTFFSEQRVFFSKEEIEIFRKTLRLVGDVSVYFGFVVIFVNFLLYRSFGLLANIFGLMLVSPFFILVYRREVKSRGLADELAGSLQKTSWLKHFLHGEGRKTRRRKT